MSDRVARKGAAIAAFLAAAALPLIGGTPAHAAAATPVEGTNRQIAADVGRRINLERAARGVPQATEDANLSAGAQAWAQHLVDTGTFTHEPGYSGEIMTTVGDSAGADRNYMQSQGHRDQLLKDTRKIGFGAACDKNGAGIVVVRFADYQGSGGDSGTPQDPIAGADGGPNYRCPQPSAPTTQPPSTTPTTQKPTPTTAKPTPTTQPPTTQPPSTTPTTTSTPPTTPTTQPSGNGGTTPTTGSPAQSPSTTAPPAPTPPADPEQAVITVTPPSSTAGQAIRLAAAGSCPTAGRHVVALVDAGGTPRATTRTRNTRAFGGSSAAYLELPATLPAGSYLVALVCSDNTQASVGHQRLEAGAQPPQVAGAVVSSTDTTTPDGATIATDNLAATSPAATEVDITKIRAADAAQRRAADGGSSMALPITVAFVLIIAGLGGLYVVYRRRGHAAA